MDVQHKQIICGNTRVFFPFEPYETQKNFMKSVVESLETKKNALLESPTGTGKTLSLLCSSLAWVQGQSGTQSIIYYTSRTHMQLSQAAKEMKRTAYRKIPAVVIGSRVQMCLNEDVRSTDPHLINRTCRNAIARNACSYYSDYEQKLKTLEINDVHDIEDLASFGKTHQCCPYYASKKIAETNATVIFMPYNYLLDQSVRKSTQLKIDNSVIIFDEAHNIESALKDSVSGSFTESSLQVVQESCNNLPAKVHEALNKEKHGLTRAGYDPKDRPGSVIDEFAKQRQGKQKEKEVKTNPIEELAEKLTNERLQQVKNFAGLLTREIKDSTQPEEKCCIETIFRIMDRSGIGFSCSSHIITTLESMASFWSIAGVMNPSYVARHVSAISNLSHVLSILFPDVCKNLESQKDHQKKLLQYYSVHVKGIYQESSHLTRGMLKDREINLWCLHPAIGLKKVFESTSIFGPRSVIVTSGTLEPMRLMQKELEMDFKIQKSFQHVIGENQLKILILNESFRGFPLTSDFKSSQRDKYPEELGNTLIPLFKVLPYGTLIFFPSYSAMNRVLKKWRKTKIWAEMTSISSIYVEQGNQDQFMSDINSYKRITSAANSENNCRAIFFCVCRGKLSEGINLEGNQCRTVVVVGLPYPNLKDPKVQSTKNFHETRNNQYWYSEQMRRALNQTIGRVIRKKTDFGLLLLIDPRFSQYKYSLSEWTRNFYPVEYVSMSQIDQEIKGFFRQHGIDIKQSATQSAGAFEIGYSSSLKPIPRDVEMILDGSPFSEEGDFETGFSSSQNKPSQGKQKSAQQKLDDMVAVYRAAKEKQHSQPAISTSPKESTPKRQKTSLEAFNSIFSQSQHIQPSAQTNFQGISSDQDVVFIQSFPSGDSCPTNKSSIQNVPALLSSSSDPSGQQVLSIAHASAHQATTIRTNSTTQSTATTQGTVSSLNYSITRQASDKDRPTTYICCICKNEAIRPHSTMCPCDRVGCRNCLYLLAGRKCFKCKTTLKKRDFKPRLFKSAFHQDERTPVIVVDNVNRA